MSVLCFSQRFSSFMDGKSGVYNLTEVISVLVSMKPLHFIIISVKKNLGIPFPLGFLMTRTTKSHFSVLIIKLNKGKKLGLILEKGKSRQVQIQVNVGVTV